MEIAIYSVGALMTNCYVLADDITKEAVIIDPADNADGLLKEIDKKGYKLQKILLTHGHIDHIMAAEEIRKRLNIPIYAHEAEKAVLESAQMNLSLMIFKKNITLIADKFIKEGDIVKFGNNELKVIHIPGHTPGGICFYSEKDNILIAGDTLFDMSIGRTDFPGGNYSDLVNSINDKLFKLPEDTKVFPGHGNPTDIGREKKGNPAMGYGGLWD